jgi:hypothetical protein
MIGLKAEDKGLELLFATPSDLPTRWWATRCGWARC